MPSVRLLWACYLESSRLPTGCPSRRGWLREPRPLLERAVAVGGAPAEPGLGHYPGDTSSPLFFATRTRSIGTVLDINNRQIGEACRGRCKDYDSCYEREIKLAPFLPPAPPSARRLLRSPSAFLCRRISPPSCGSAVAISTRFSRVSFLRKILWPPRLPAGFRGDY